MEDEDFDTREVARLAAAMPPADVQLYYQIALGGRRDLAMAPEPRLGFEMTLLRMLAFRPDTGEAGGETLARPAPSASAPVRSRVAPAVPAAAPAAAKPAAVAPAGGAPANVDAANWPAILEAAQLNGMVRQFALNCVPASFDGVLLCLRLDAAATDRRTRQIEESLAQGLSKHFGREIRLSFETSQAGLVTPARQRTLDEQDRVTAAIASFQQDPVVRGLRERFGADADLSSVKPANPELQ
jgi:DNA polymerase-3 subunit gamma/tau